MRSEDAFKEQRRPTVTGCVPVEELVMQPRRLPDERLLAEWNAANERSRAAYYWRFFPDGTLKSDQGGAPPKEAVRKPLV